MTQLLSRKRRVGEASCCFILCRTDGEGLVGHGENQSLCQLKVLLLGLR